MSCIAALAVLLALLGGCATRPAPCNGHSVRINTVTAATAAAAPGPRR